MEKIIRDAAKKFTAGLEEHESYMMDMIVAKPILEDKENELLVIDIRPEKSYKSGHIPGSVNFPLADLPGRVDELDPNQAILVVCTLDAMSAYATMILRLLGFTATLVRGGVPAFADAGGELESS